MPLWLSLWPQNPQDYMPGHIWRYLLPRLSLTLPVFSTYKLFLSLIPCGKLLHIHILLRLGPDSSLLGIASTTRLWQEGLNRSERPARHVSVMVSGGPFTRGGALVLNICVSSKCTRTDGFSRNVCSGNKQLACLSKSVTSANSLPHNLQVWHLLIFHKEKKHLESLGFIKSCQMHRSNVSYMKAEIITQKS